MNNEPAEIIKDKSSIKGIFNDIFARNQTFLRINNINVKVDYEGYSEGHINLRISKSVTIPQKCMVMARANDFIFSAILNFERKQRSDIHLFTPIEIRKYNSPRREERKQIQTEQKKIPVLFIHNMMSDFLIEQSLDFDSKKAKQIGEVIKVKLESHFQYIKIFFLHEGIDPRMNYFRENIRPIYIPNIHDDPSEKKKGIYEYYMKNIYQKDGFLQNTKYLVSEISVPILYRMRIPYGFVQVNNNETIPETSMSIVKKMAVIVEELLHKHNVFQKDDRKLVVSDVSRSGLAIVFKDRKCIRYFKEKCLIYFDLLLPDNKKINILATVRHISQMNNKIFKVGCEITDLDALSEVYYEEFLESLR